MTSKLLTSLGAAKTDIKICLNSRRKIYSTLDRIDGTVIVTPSADLAFDSIEVEFVGTSRVWTERMATTAAISGRSQAFHQFLRLSQPGTELNYPQDRILRAGQSYKFPFIFAVPQHLLPRVCGHPVQNEALRDEHLQLPPSLGDCEVESKSQQLDDLAPEMASIRYGVYTKVTRLKQEKGQLVRSTIVAKARKVRIVPAVEERPPLSIDEHLDDFVMRREKKLRKGLLKGKMGTLVMEAQQPSAFILPAQDAEVEGRTTTMATVQLRFDPAEPNAQPPRLNNLTSKLKSTTFFSTAARRDYPKRSDGVHDMCNGFHSVNLEISSRCMANVEWTKVEGQRCASPTLTSSSRRRTSSTISGPLVPPEPSPMYTGGTYYTARILVPIELPANKAFVPSFHSCLISRVYSLGLSLSTNTAFGGNMDLRLPVQIAASGSLRNESPRPSITSLVEMEDENESSEIDDFFEPRTIHAPDAEFVGNSVLRDVDLEAAPVTRRDSAFDDLEPSELPQYSLFAPGTRNQRVGIPAF